MLDLQTTQLKSCGTLADNLPILQAKLLEWGRYAFSTLAWLAKTNFLPDIGAQTKRGYHDPMAQGIESMPPKKDLRYAACASWQLQRTRPGGVCVLI